MKHGTQCVIYCRVSSSRQDNEGFSIPAQKRYLNEYARKHGYVVVETFEDDETAGSKGRTNFERMMEFLKSNKNIKTILVEKTDRMYRNFSDYVDVEDLKVDIILVKENEIVGPNASSHTKFIHGIKVLMAKNFLDNLSEEVRKGYDEKVKMGLYPSNPMFGYTTAKINGKRTLVPKEHEASIVKRIFELYATGQHSLRSILDTLQKEGLMLLIDKNFHLSSIYTILNNPVYYGDFRWKGTLYKGIHEPIISRALWNQVRAIQESFNNKGQSKRYNTMSFLLKGFMVCGECGRKITAERKKGRYIYYKCTRYKTNCGQKPISEEELIPQVQEMVKSITIPQEAVNYVEEALKESLEMKRNTIDGQVGSLTAEKIKLEARLDALYEDKLDHKIEEGFYQRKYSEYRTKLSTIEHQLERYNKANLNYYELGSQILELSKNAYQLYLDANDEEKRKLLGFLLSNFFLKDGKLIPDYKKPFDLFVKYAACSDWQGLANEFRTFSIFDSIKNIEYFVLSLRQIQSLF